MLPGLLDENLRCCLIADLTTPSLSASPNEARALIQIAHQAHWDSDPDLKLATAGACEDRQALRRVRGQGRFVHAIQGRGGARRAGLYQQEKVAKELPALEKEAWTAALRGERAAGLRRITNASRPIRQAYLTQQLKHQMS